MLNSLVSAYRVVASVMGETPTLLSTITLGFTTFSKQGRELASTLSGAIPKVDQISNKFNVWNDALKNTKQELMKHIAEQKKLIKANQEGSQGYIDAQNKLKGFNASLNQTKLAMAGVQAMATLMNAAISAGLTMLASWAIGAVASIVDEMITTKAELQELNQEFNNTFADTGNTINLVDQYKSLSETLRNTSRDSEEYASISDELNAVEEQLLSLYPNLNSAIEKNSDLKWKNVDAIEAITKAEMERAQTEARVILGKNGISGYDDIKAEIDAYDELIKKRRQYNQAYDRGETSVVTGMNASGNRQITKDINDALKDTNDSIEEAEAKLQTYYNAIRAYGANGSKEFGSSLDLLAETLGYTETQIESTSDGINHMDDAIQSTVTSVDKLSQAFGAMTAPIEMLRTMIDEFQEFGGLTDETYLDVLESGNSQLIALLADAQNFLPNAQAVLKQLETAQADAAKNLIDTAAREQGMFNGVIDSAKKTSEAVTESMQQQADAINNAPQVDMTQLKDEYDTLINSALMALGVTGSAAQEMESVVLQALRNYVAEGNVLYTEDVANSLSATEAKAMANEMWLNDDISRLAQAVLQFKDQYDIDMVNWANDIINKEAANKTYSDAVLSQISEMITLNANRYSDDTVNWASALSNKSANNVTMVNNVIGNIAKMILANASNYSSDTVNWANAIVNKSTNNANLCTTITNSMASVINNLANQYGVDARNFANSTQSKLNNIRDLNAAYREMTGSELGIPMRDAFNLDKFASIKDQVGKYLDSKKNSVVVGTTGSTYVGQNVSGLSGVSSVGSGNYVSNVGSKDKDKNKDKNSGKKDVADLKDLTDRYYDLNNALQKVENALDEVETQLGTATGKNRIALLEKEITLLNDKRNALMSIRAEEQNELNELRQILSSNGFAFAADGQISNYKSRLDAMVANANKLTGDAKENAIANVKQVSEQLDRYTKLLLTEIPEITNQINGISGSISNLRDEIDEIIKSTTYFTKDFVDRYYELNNALKQVENQLNAINTAMENADDNKAMELLDKQIELYVKQGEALAAIRKEYEKELSEYSKELYDAGFKFNADGTISNYQELIDKMVKDANQIMDGKEQEKAIERIENLISTIEKYTGLLLDDIPDITDDINDLANSVISSQKEIANILSKQRDEYIDNLKKETDALKKEINNRKNLLNKQWEEEDAADELAEKQQKLNELEDQLTIALRTGDEELIKNIREQISAAQKEINDFIRDQERDYISDRFDEDLDNLDESLDKKLEEINEKLSDKELLNLVQSGVRDLTGVLKEIEGGTKGVRTAFTAIGTTISETWISALDTFVEKLESLDDVNIGLNIASKIGDAMKGFSREININQGNLIVEGNITQDVLPIVQNMIDVANNNLINSINAAFSR